MEQKRRTVVIVSDMRINGVFVNRGVYSPHIGLFKTVVLGCLSEWH